ncbi:MAG: glycosyltransferase family 4 protein [Eggerthellaceae bacterium]|nr:glycosyltransferase family 4 protein [Eggerthellaceae bacterium]
MIFQLIHNIIDATSLSATAFAIDASLCARGEETKLYAEIYDHQKQGDLITPLHELGVLGEDDVVILHFGFDGFDHIWEFAQVDCKKVLLFYGVLDPAVFKGYDRFAAEVSENASKELGFLAKNADLALCTSEWCLEELLELGMKCKHAFVHPVIQDASDSDCSSEEFNRYSRSKGNKILSYGPVAPNRCYDDVIRAFACYKDACDPSASLCILGYYDENGRCYRELQKLIEGIAVEDVHFDSNQDLLQQYCSVSDALISLSDCEDIYLGMVSAMRSHVPVASYDVPSVRGILGSAALYIKDKDPLTVAAALQVLASEPQVRAACIEAGDKRQSLFSSDDAVAEILEHVGIY